MPCIGGICTRDKGKAPDQISLSELRDRQRAALTAPTRQPIAQPQSQQQAQTPGSIGMQGSAPAYGSHEWMMQNNPYYLETMGRHAQLPQQPPAMQPTGTVRYRNGQEVPLTEANYNRFMDNLPQGHPTRQFMEQQAPSYQYAQPGMFSGMESSIGEGLSNLLGGGESSSYQASVRAGKGGMQFPRFTPQQEQVMDRLMGMGLSQAQALQTMNAYDFEPIRAAAHRGFQEQGIPSIMERFTGMAGGRGGVRSSALPQQLSQGLKGLESNLASLEAQHRLKAGALQQEGLKGLLGMGLQPRFDTAYAPPAPSFMSSLGQGLGHSAGGVGSLLLKGALGL